MSLRARRRSLTAAVATLAVGGSLAIASTASAASIPLGSSSDTGSTTLYGLLNQSYAGLESADTVLNGVGDHAVPCTPTGAPPAPCTGFPSESTLTASQAQQIAADFTGSTINGTAPTASTPSWSTKAQAADTNYSTDAPKVGAAGTAWGSISGLVGVDTVDPTDFPGGLYTVDGDVSISSTATVTAIGQPMAYSTTFGVSGPAAHGFVLPSGFTLTFPANFTINTALVSAEIQQSQVSNPPTASAIGTASVTSPEIAALVPGSKGVDSTATVYAVATASLTQPEFEVYLGQGDYILGTLSGVTFPLTVTFGEPVVGGQPTALPVSTVTLNFPATTSPLKATSCTTAGTLTGTMTDAASTLASTYFGDSTDSGAIGMSATPTVVTNKCAPPNTATGSMGGLTTSSPTLTLRLKTANAFNSVTVGLPKGLSFVKSTKLAKEISASSGKVKSVKVASGKLVISLKSKVTSTVIKTRKGAIHESLALIKSIKKHKTKKLTVSVRAGSASMKASIKA